MTTQLIRDTMRLAIDGGMDPTELYWFDISAALTDHTHADVRPLMDHRPPFDQCMVAWQGQVHSGRPYEVLMLVKTDGDAVLLTAWKGPVGQMPRPITAMAYWHEGDVLQYGSLDEDAEGWNDDEAKFCLAFVGTWLKSMSCEAHVPFVRPTFTNRRKIAAGKLPSYDWRTVIVEPRTVKREHQGGTHASPRQHDRRGHIRRLASGRQVWVKPCKVGDASKGAVFHDYEVRA